MKLLIAVMVAACVWVELKIMNSVPWLFKLVSKHRMLSLGFSLGLSLVLGGLFGAAGLIVFAAGVLSTVFVQPFYAAKKSGQWDAGQQKVVELRAKLEDNQAMYRARARQGLLILKLVGQVLMVPVRIFFFGMDLVEYVSGKHYRSS